MAGAWRTWDGFDLTSPNERIDEKSKDGQFVAALSENGRKWAVVLFWELLDPWPGNDLRNLCD